MTIKNEASEREGRPALEDVVDRVANTHITGLRFEPNAKRVRVRFAGETVADSTRMMMLHERGRLAIYYFPMSDVREDLLVPSEKRTSSPLKGEARYWSVRVGDRVAQDAAWEYPEPPQHGPDLSSHLGFYWNAMDAWFEEDEEVFVHARDPYHRIDVLDSSRRVRVILGGQTVADTTAARFLFETTLPTRYYIPKSDVRLDLLEESPTATACAYKGSTSKYWRARNRSPNARDVAWCYEEPRAEVAGIAGRIAFFNERVDAIEVDGEATSSPATQWT